MAFIVKTSWIMESPGRPEDTLETDPVTHSKGNISLFEKKKNPAFDNSLSMRENNFLRLDEQTGSARGTVRGSMDDPFHSDSVIPDEMRYV
jgi:hypothetical protein